MGAPTPMDAGPWVDEFVDSTLIKTTVDTEVVGGEVRLATGAGTGLVASVDILPPAGHRYDMVLAEVSTPGASSVRISVLNASEDSTVVGFVNQPIPGFLKIPRTQLILTGVDPVRYPSLRLQADLEAAGTDRPALLMWSVYFVPDDTWQDDFLGDGKMYESSKINVTGGAAEVDLSRQNTYGPGYGNYVAYPPILVGRYSDQSNRLEMGAFYPNSGNNDYENRVQLPAENVRGFAAADIDQDGYLDMVVANQRNSGDYTRDSWILWGNDTGRWDTNRRTDLATDSARDPALGDVDGDGYLDVLIGCSGEVRVFLNPQNRSFSSAHDIALPGSSITGMASLDLNSDGYDDVVLAEEYASGGSDYSRIYFGGSGGPDTTDDIRLPTGGSVYEVALDDFDGDGNVDVVFANTIQSGGDRAQMFYGSETGPDTTADFEAEVDGTQWGLCVATGDIDGDGWKDIVFGRVMSNAEMYVFWGAASGFSNSPTQTSDPLVDGGPIYDIVVIDVNKDGYDDVIGGNSWLDRVDVYFGNANGIDGNSDKRMNSDGATPIGVSADKLKYNRIVGNFITDSINRPLDKKWDILVIEGDFPANTEVEVSVLDAGLQPVMGYSGLRGPDVDLSGVIIPGIHLQVTMRSLDKVTTPRLDRVFVKWMDRDVWREQFYGKAKVNRIMGLEVRGGTLTADPTLGGAQEIVFANLRSDATFNVNSQAFRDAGGLDYLSVPPINFRVPSGAGDVEVTDINGDGWQDVAFAVYQVTPGNYISESPIFLGSAVGWGTMPNHKFSTKGARDVLVADLDDDGFNDVVFAQEYDGMTYEVNSTLFWGSASGWSDDPDVEFVTTGASGVDAADLDGDGLLDLVFASHRDDATFNSPSMVFLQTASGFNGSAPDQTIATRGARAVALADIDEDSRIDAVFANEFTGGMAEISSQVFWGATGGTFGTTPTNLPTQGATDVAAADLDRDGDLDLVFANAYNNTPSYIVDSYIYLGSGSRSFSSSADITLPTLGASGIAVADLDGTGWRDLVFSCQYDGATYELGSRVYLGGASGYGSSPDIELPTRGAMGVGVAELVRKDAGGYMSKLITPEDPNNAGVFETFKYTAVGLPAGHTGKIRVLDADTGELLAETTLVAGYNEWSLADKFRIREHDSIFIQVTVEGLDPAGGFSLDDLWLNWSPRDKRPPRVLDLTVSEPTVLRTRSIEAIANVTDEYDYPDELTVRLEHRKSNTTDAWMTFMISGLEYRNNAWRAIIKPRVDIPVGLYDLRVRVVDRDSMDSGWFTVTEAFEVLNNIPTAPEVRIDPARPVRTSTLEAIIVSSAFDVESTGMTYRYTWFRDGELIPNLTMSRVTSAWLDRGQNWSVEVRAFDGDDEGPPALAWRVIENAAPVVDEVLDPVTMDEDVANDRALTLRNAFTDPDGDPLTWRVDPSPSHLEVSIDPDTGMVSITPEKDWNGQEDVTFVASDGEFDESQVVPVTVRPINDAPYFVSVNGQPYTGQVVTLTVTQGQELAVDIVVIDVEGDDTIFKGNVTKVKVDLATGRMTFTPTNDDVGLLRFRLTVNDNVNTDLRNYLDFEIEVTNVNDPISEVYIISPRKGESYKWNESVGLRGVGTDPDEKHGQDLNFSWRSNITGPLGYGSSINFRFTDSGRHNITLTVTDGENTMSASVEFIVGEKPYVPPNGNGGGGEDELPWTLIIGIVLALVAVLVVVMVLARRKAAQEAAAKVAWEAAQAEADPEAEKRRKLAEFADAVKETADKMEAERDAPRAADGSIKVAGTGMVPTSDPSHKMRLTERPSEETARLWATLDEGATVVDDAEKEALRRETEKRKIQSAIQAMPYGIPAPELRHIEPWLLAEEMVDAKHHSLPDGREIVSIRGKWYHGDPEDSSTFLMPYKEPVKKAPAADASEWEEA